MSDYAIRVSGLTKRFDEVVAVDNVDFAVPQGEIFGFLGPNGAGKTTTINILTTVLRPTEGVARVCGYDVASEALAVRRCSAVVPQEYTADEDLTGYENIMLCAELYGIPKREAKARADELLKLVELSDAAHRQVDTYSGGMRRRLELACGLVSRPRVLFLDEPTLGLDVQTRRAVWNYIRLLKERYDMTLFMTTHYLEEADSLCDRIAIIDHGKIVKIGSPEELKESLGGDIVELSIDGGDDQLTAALRSIPTIRDVQVKEGSYRIKVANGEETAPTILEVVRGTGLKVKRIWMTKPTLDEAYMEYTGKSLRSEEGNGDDTLKRRFFMRRVRT